MLSNLLLIERTDTNVSRDKQFSVFTVCIYDSFLSHCKIDKSKRADLKVRTCCLIYLKTTEPCIKEQSEIMISNGLVNSFMHIMYSTMLCFISCTLWSAPQEFCLCIVSCVIPTLQQFACPHHILLFKGLELVRFLNVLKEVCIYSALLHSPKNEHNLLTLMSFPNLYKFISYVEHKISYFTEIHHRRHFYFLRVTEFKRFCVTGMTLLSSLVRSSGPVAWGLPLADGTLFALILSSGSRHFPWGCCEMAWHVPSLHSSLSQIPMIIRSQVSHSPLLSTALRPESTGCLPTNLSGWW